MSTDNTGILCLNVPKVKSRMRQLGITRGALSKEIGMKDYHTLSFYFLNPDKIRLNHISAIARVLGSSPYPYDDFVKTINSEEELRELINEEYF